MGKTVTGGMQAHLAAVNFLKNNNKNSGTNSPAEAVLPKPNKEEKELFTPGRAFYEAFKTDTLPNNPAKAVLPPPITKKTPLQKDGLNFWSEPIGSQLSEERLFTGLSEEVKRRNLINQAKGLSPYEVINEVVEERKKGLSPYEVINEEVEERKRRANETSKMIREYTLTAPNPALPSSFQRSGEYYFDENGVLRYKPHLKFEIGKGDSIPFGRVISDEEKEAAREEYYLEILGNKTQHMEPNEKSANEK